MPEMRFRIRWPDGTPETCYSPSLVIKDFFAPGESYSLHEFLRLSRAALMLASQRVETRYGWRLPARLEPARPPRGHGQRLHRRSRRKRGGGRVRRMTLESS